MTESDKTLADLNALAGPLGFSVEFDGMWKTAPTGSSRSLARYQARDADEIRDYLNRRAENRWWWWLDMSDESITVENPRGTGTTTEVRLSLRDDPDSAVIVGGGVCGDSRSGEIHSFYCRTEDRPAIGRWHR